MGNIDPHPIPKKHKQKTTQETNKMSNINTHPPPTPKQTKTQHKKHIAQKTNNMSNIDPLPKKTAQHRKLKSEQYRTPQKTHNTET
jgi:hypothetical protein